MLMASRQSILTIVLFGTPFFTQAQSGGLDERLNEAFMPFATWWEGFILSTLELFGVDVPIVLILLSLGAVFFTIYFGFVNIGERSTRNYFQVMAYLGLNSEGAFLKNCHCRHRQGYF